ncbi:hypothetical protein PENSPDRAFT_656421 [Peniophora sp. CONT]|nr:hypothetical protein PENSPDRAFT_656421 [Peniophora sp. CONT]
MHPTLRSLEHVHKPLIRFLGKHQWSSEAPHAHPSAPKEIADKFKQLFSSRASSGSSGSGSAKNAQSSGGALEFWEVPDRLFRPRIRRIDDWEIDAVQTGGASLH